MNASPNNTPPAAGNRLPPRPHLHQAAIGFLGGAISIFLLALLGSFFATPLLMAPFGASCVLLYAAPDTPLAQPRNVICGHVFSTLVGLCVFNLAGAGAWQMGLAVGLAIAIMQATRTLHAPAGANPLVISLSGGMSWSYVVTPVLVGTILLVLFAFGINNIGRGKKWPKYWWH